MYLTKFLTLIYQLLIAETNYECYNLERLWFYKFSLKFSFLVSCSCFCSSSLTEVLTGPQILSSDWLNKDISYARHVGEKEYGNDFLLNFSLSFLSQLPGKKVENKNSELLSVLFCPHHVIFVNKSSHKKSAIFKRRAEWADSYKKRLEKKQLWSVTRI